MVLVVFIMTVLGVGPLSQLTYRQDQETAQINNFNYLNYLNIMSVKLRAGFYPRNVEDFFQ